MPFFFWLTIWTQTRPTTSEIHVSMYEDRFWISKVSKTMDLKVLVYARKQRTYMQKQNFFWILFSSNIGIEYILIYTFFMLERVFLNNMHVYKHIFYWRMDKWGAEVKELWIEIELWSIQQVLVTNETSQWDILLCGITFLYIESKCTVPCCALLTAWHVGTKHRNNKQFQLFSC